MEKSKEWKEKKYIQACNILDYLNKKGNFCNIREENGCVTCNGDFSDRKGLCCFRCSHLKEGGCDTKSIACKISYCYVDCGPRSCDLVETQEQEEIAYQRLKIVTLIEEFFDKYNIPLKMLRMSMEDQFKIHEDQSLLKSFDKYVSVFVDSKN